MNAGAAELGLRFTPTDLSPTYALDRVETDGPAAPSTATSGVGLDAIKAIVPAMPSSGWRERPGTEPRSGPRRRTGMGIRERRPRAGTVDDALVRRLRATIGARPEAVVAGRTAAALWIGALGGVPPGDDREAGGVLVAPLTEGPAEAVVPGRGGRSRPDLVVRADRLEPDEIVAHGDVGLRLTTPARTAFDLARALPTDDAVVAVDALAVRHAVSAEELRSLAHRHPGVRGRRAVFPVADLIDGGSTSPARTRIRLAVRRADLGTPVAGLVVTGAEGEAAGRLDLAWSKDRCGLEVGRSADEAWARAGPLVEDGWLVRRIGDDHTDPWLVLQVLGLREQRRGRDRPLTTAFARRRPRPSVP